MKYKVLSTRKFKKNFRLCLKQGRDKTLIDDIINKLSNGEKLPAKHNAHKLKGEYKGLWECHVAPDWLLIWQQNDKELILILTDTGSHSYLF